MRFGHSYPPPGLMLFTNISKITTSAGALVQISHSSASGRYQASASDGDRLYYEFFCQGSETKLEITTLKNADRGIWDLYVNGNLDSSGYDDYAASGAAINREIVLTVPVVAGRNTIQLVVNGKNALSSSYIVSSFGASLQ